ncbi:uncharacterized protein LOC141713114 isoform X2 [Apium graveolens]|uniref:uncharacterized protein LOC141713114 isoform X2 n=1 Tax=Apium graveolens TaxID=4045 RepID=UPI003D7A8B25
MLGTFLSLVDVLSLFPNNMRRQSANLAFLKNLNTRMKSLKVFEKSPISLRGVRPMSLMEMESLLNSYHLTVYPGLESVYNTAISYREIFSLKS